MDIALKTTTGYGIHAGTPTRSVSKDTKINTACTEMESLFIQNMFREMRASIPRGGLTSGGKAEEMFTDMLDAELAKTFSASGGIGLSSMFRSQLETIPEIGETDQRK